MFTDPHWFLLLLPAIWLLFRLAMPTRKILVLRIIILLLVLSALAGASLKLPGRDGMIIVVADRSLSMPSDSDSRVKEALSILKDEMPSNSNLGLISFARNARVLMSPANAAFSGFTSELEPGASNLADGIDKALSLIPHDSAGRILVISDGQWTGSDPKFSAFKAARRAIPLDYRCISRNAVKDLAITDFQLPGQLSPGESFIIKANVFSPIDQSVEVQLSSSKQKISSFAQQMRAGNNAIVFQHSAPDSSMVKYELSVNSADSDSIPENNQAVAIAEVTGKKPVLLITQGDSAFFKQVLQHSGQKVVTLRPGDMHWNLESLAGYSAVVLDNVSANAVTQHGMRVLSAWVTHLGGGLLMTGGKNSYGSGGYYQSPLEEILPVSLELRSEHRKLQLALMIVLDRSGSMTAPSRGGRTKMDLANMASAGCLDLLSPMDEFGLLAVDTEPHIVVPLGKITNKEMMRNKILRVESMGGGIYVYEGLSKAAKMLSGARATTRHIILFADAADAEQPGTYWELLDKAAKAGITVSVIGLGRESDPDGNLLKKIAAAGQGRIFFTREPEELPRLFSQDTFVAAKSTFIDEPSAISSTGRLPTFIGYDIGVDSVIGGYNLSYIKGEAIQLLRSNDENKAPVLAAWNSGLGRVACYTGVTAGEYAGAFIEKQEAADLLTAVSGWAVADKRQFIANMPITQKIVRGQWQATLHLDPEREREFFNENPVVTVLRSRKGLEPEKIELPMNWLTADSLQASLQLAGNETIVAMVDAGPRQKLQLYPVCQPYSPEYRSPGNDQGSEKLKELAMISRGREMIDLANVWQTMPRKDQLQSIADPLLFLALLLFIIEVAERRTSFLSLLLGMISRAKGGKKAAPAAKQKSQTGKAARKFPENRIKVSELLQDEKPQTKQIKGSEIEDSGFTGALRKAKNQAGKRTKK